MKSEIVNALSVDVEEYYHASIFQEGTWGVDSRCFPSRVDESVRRVLALLDHADIQATFFVLGEVAAGHPELVKSIAAEGHEVACHGYRHEVIWRQTPEQFRADVRRAKGTLEDLTGQPVIGYRAPNFSIDRSGVWAYEILLEEGFRYDSSTYPIRHDRYGDVEAPRFPDRLPGNGHGTLIEFPVGIARLLGMNLPIGSGGYFRLLPSSVIRYGIRHVNVHERQPLMFFFHPWELDPNQPRPLMPWYHRFRHSVGVGREEAKLADLLRHVRFSTARDILGLNDEPRSHKNQQAMGTNSSGAPFDAR